MSRPSHAELCDFVARHPEPTTFGPTGKHREWQEAFEHFAKTGEDLFEVKQEGGQLISNHTVYMYHKDSRGGRSLNEQIGARLLMSSTVRRKLETEDEKKPVVLVNWGHREHSVPDPNHRIRWINHPSKVNAVSDQTRMLSMLRHGGVTIPDTTEKLSDAIAWITSGKEVVAYGSRGPSLSADFDSFALANRWSVYKKKSADLRIHVVRDEVVGIEEKVLRKNDPFGRPIEPQSVDKKIKSRVNGYVYMKYSGEVPPEAMTEAYKAIHSTGLDFGSVDLIWNRITKSAYVLDVCPIPIMTADVAKAYAKKIKKITFAS